MLRRAFLSLLPALLALAIVVGTPGVSTGGPEASTATRSHAVAPSPIARGSLTQDIPDAVVNLRADEDETSDDRIIQVVSTIVWPQAASKAPIIGGAGIVAPTHRACAAPPRAPPTA